MLTSVWTRRWSYGAEAGSPRLGGHRDGCSFWALLMFTMSMSIHCIETALGLITYWSSSSSSSLLLSLLLLLLLMMMREAAAAAS